jgi:phosphohistidine phosphatase
MKVVLIRHGIAEAPDPKAPDGKADAIRPLTRDGKKKMRHAAQGLREIVKKFDMIAYSPLERTAQTADIIASVYADHGGEVSMVKLPELAPGKKSALVLAWLQNQPPQSAIALVGHEPNLSRCAAMLAAGKERRMLEMKKGAACVIEFPEDIAAGRGIVRTLVQPGVLRALRHE